MPVPIEAPPSLLRYNYRDALTKSIFFFEGHRLPPSQMVTWKRDFRSRRQREGGRQWVRWLRLDGGL
ncbi:hypothetical protein EUGRSUZ_G00830 [Eucalyptus grandis]|uniref:Uncharacterized protein n=2 Tax=Eucalyptus grandis TaxID=71139 RepID=A0ACC3K105_EUCGR|nr:hypothetical protein EUGRSUZ_G00830 [Eucalyptus grandis]